MYLISSSCHLETLDTFRSMFNFEAIKSTITSLITSSFSCVFKGNFLILEYLCYFSAQLGYSCTFEEGK